MSTNSTSILAQDLHFTHLPTLPLIQNANFHLTEGWTGVIGGNGQGKTTLLELICGQHHPQQGHIRIQPIDASVHLCPQRVEHCSQEIEDLAHDWSTQASRLKDLLELELDQLYTWETLSPGERKRWQIGAALLRKPQLLLLDEPTNHLDTLTRERLIEALADYQGLGLIVSHDRGLLDELTHATLRLHGGCTYYCQRAYGDAEERWQHSQHQRWREVQDQRDKLARNQRRLNQQQEQSREADTKISTSKRLKNAHDSDARSSNAKGRVMNAAQKLSRSAGVLRRQIERDEQETLPHIEKPLHASLFFYFRHAPKHALITKTLNTLNHGPGTKALLNHEVTLTVQRDSRIQLRGPNGAGKTTLMEQLLHEGDLAREHILYMPQELTMAEIASLLEEINALSPSLRGRVYQIVAALGVDPARIIQSEALSPGEARKLFLALGMSKEAWLLLLDEPTNHMDLPSIEHLEAALFNYPGAMIIITHDEFFARQCTDTIWHIEDGALTTLSALHR